MDRKIGGKILEEARELIEAADERGQQGRDHFVYEAGDLIYHTCDVGLARVDLEEVAAELARREGHPDWWKKPVARPIVSQLVTSQFAPSKRSIADQSDKLNQSTKI